ncbi:MAG: hypothetical protein ABIH41_01765 [Nanoarchaeota archaeon]
MDMLSFDIVSRPGASVKDVIALFVSHGFKRAKRPDFVISFGGDGTFLVSEQRFPGVPKLLVKNSDMCVKCDPHSLDVVLERLKKGRYGFKEFPKLRAALKGETFDCVNDVVVRNALVTRAIRFSVSVNDPDRKKAAGVGSFIGDGVVISSVFGSTGYFHSIARHSFEKGIGIAFNNVTRDMPALVVDETCRILVKVERGPAVAAYDTIKKPWMLQEGDEVTVTGSKNHALLIDVGTHSIFDAP